ncbi:MAG: (Fe-S)-binding protein [Anaerolineae bacterium]|nr:(Fe-S)-binding protein [Anaerolineae bacterium]
MLTGVEKMLFTLLALLAVGATYASLREMYLIINRGDGKLYLDNLPRRAWRALVVYLGQPTTLKTRRVSSLFHLGIVWGFTYFFLVNLLDGLRGFFPEFEGTLKSLGIIYDVYRLGADVLSVAVLVGVAYFLLRRFVLPNKAELEYHDNVLLHPKVKNGGVKVDSVIVGGFILLHIGARFLGESVYVAANGTDLFSPFATLVSPVWGGATEDGLKVLEHIFWWVALGGILLFTPYFAQSKHAHLFMAPINFLTKPKRTSLGEMTALDLENADIEQFGVNTLTQLPKTNILDGFACIMCNRCQDVCPAYTTGKELSPSALEVNKRYLMRDNMSGLAAGEDGPSLIGMAISASAVWACTSCGACVDICPVGNEPMLDILNIRRDAVLMQSEFPAELQGAFKGMERAGNPWQAPREDRFKWAKGLEFPVPTVDENPDFDILYWTGCAVNYDPRAQLTARALVKVLNTAGVNFAVLGEQENCTGDVARRAGKEDLYYELATGNVELLNEVKPKRIVVTCPHCFHNIGKEYHQFGGHYEVVHHTELIEELIGAGKVPTNAHPKKLANVTFHDPCYLGRHNDVVDAPRTVLNTVVDGLIEMPRTKKNSFCCGAGGAQFWKEEEHGTKAVNVERYEEAKATGAEVLAVGCPFCAQMFESAKALGTDGPVIKDVVELIAERL